MQREIKGQMQNKAELKKKIFVFIHSFILKTYSQ